MQRQLKDELANSPLAVGEVRRVEGMGQLFISLSRDLGDNNYRHQYTLEFDAVPHHFFVCETEQDNGVGA